MTGVEWRTVPGYPKYQVSSDGRVRSHQYRQPRELKFNLRAWDGRAQVTLWNDQGYAYFRVHTLVALAFLGPKPEWADVVRHLNDDKLDNRAENLAYGTHSDNVRDLIRNGRHPETRKTACPHGHPYDEANTLLKKDGSRSCRTCRRERNRRNSEFRQRWREAHREEIRENDRVKAREYRARKRQERAS